MNVIEIITIYQVDIIFDKSTKLSEKTTLGNYVALSDYLIRNSSDSYPRFDNLLLACTVGAHSIILRTWTFPLSAGTPRFLTFYIIDNRVRSSRRFQQFAVFLLNHFFDIVGCLSLKKRTPCKFVNPVSFLSCVFIPLQKPIGVNNATKIVLFITTSFNDFFLILWI